MKSLQGKIKFSALLLTVTLLVFLLHGCGNQQLSEQDVDRIAKRVIENLEPQIEKVIEEKLAEKAPAKNTTDSDDKTVMKIPAPLRRDTDLTKTPEDDGKPAAILVDKTPPPVKTDSPTVVKLNNHIMLNKEQFDEIYTHITQYFPVSSLRTAETTEVLKHVVKVELLSAEATMQNVNKDPNFLKALQMPLTNAVITLLVGDHERDQPDITDEMLKAEYEKTKVVYRTRPYISANMIEIDGLEFIPKGQTESMKAADLVAKLRKAPETFPDTAKNISLSPTAAMNGKMDRIYPGDLTVDVHRLLESAEIGKILDPVKVQNGNYVIFQVTAKHEEAFKPFELVKDSIKAQMLKKRRAQTLEAIEETAKKAIDSELHLDRLDTEGPAEELLARVGNVDVTRAVFETILSNHKNRKEKFETVEQKKGLLKGLFQQHLFSVYALNDSEFKKLHNVYLIFFQKEKLAEYYVKTRVGRPDRISDEDLEKHYKEHLENFAAKEPYIKTRHIVYVAQSDKEEDIAQAKAKAVEAIEKLKNGTDIAELAKDADSSSGNDKADPTFWFTRGPTVLGSKFYESALAGEKGQIIEEPIQVKNNFFVVKVADKSENIPLELAKNTIATELTQKAQLDKYKALLEDAEKKHDIQTFPEVLK